MATKPVDTTPAVDSADEWEDVKVGLGNEWDLENDGVLIGVFMGMETIDVPDPNHPGEMRATNAYMIDVENDSGRFIWGSYNIDQAFQQINIGDMVRIEFNGVNTFKDSKTNQPKSVKTYKVQVKRAQA